MKHRRILERLHSWWLAPKPSWWPWLKRLLALFLVGGSVYYIWRRLAVDVGRLDWQSLELRWGSLGISLGLTTLCVALGGWVWKLILASLGHPLGWKESFFIHTAANLTKYLPGYGWQLLGKAYLTQRRGIPARVAAMGIALEFSSLLLTAFLVGGGIAPPNVRWPLLGELSLWGRLALLSSALLALILIPVGIHRWGEGKQRPLRDIVVPFWGAVLLMAFAWVLFGLAFGYLLRALGPLPKYGWSVAVYALSLSFII
ncbi:MAG: hypothetical protein J7M05_10475, partial [Anaerolineae bacterium]|nr:hypothetical protein [Anaerolineae bacterium]